MTGREQVLKTRTCIERRIPSASRSPGTDLPSIRLYWPMWIDAKGIFPERVSKLNNYMRLADYPVRHPRSHLGDGQGG